MYHNKYHNTRQKNTDFSNEGGMGYMNPHEGGMGCMNPHEGAKWGV